MSDDRPGGTVLVIEDDPALRDVLCRTFIEERFAAGPPSLAGCTRLEVEGDVSFGRDVVVRESVRVEGPRRVEDGTLLEG